MNYFESFNDTNDIKLIRDMTTEQINMYGFPVVLKHFNEVSKVHQDPVYNDYGSSFELMRDDDITAETHNIYMSVDYQRFNSILNSWGLSLEESSLECMFSWDLINKIYEDDIIQYLYPIDNRTYSFKLGSIDPHKSICIRGLLVPLYQDALPDTVYNLNEPKRPTTIKQIDINNLEDDEVIKI